METIKSQVLGYRVVCLNKEQCSSFHSKDDFQKAYERFVKDKTENPKDDWELVSIIDMHDPLYDK